MDNLIVSEVLKKFKADEAARPECIHPLVRDPDLRNLVALWSMSTIEFLPPKSKLPDEENDRWKWLWEKVSFDREELSVSLRLDRMKLSRLFDRAVAFRLIYPDGTTNTLAIQYIRGDIAKSLQKKPGPTP